MIAHRGLMLAMAAAAAAAMTGAPIARPSRRYVDRQPPEPSPREPETPKEPNARVLAAEAKRERRRRRNIECGAPLRQGAPTSP